MKRFIVVLSGLLVLPAFAEVAPMYYEEIIDTEDVSMIDEGAVANAPVVVPVAQPSAQNPRGTVSSGRVASRVVPSSNAVVAPRDGNARVVASANGASNISTRNTANTRAVAARSSQQIATTRRAMQKTPAISSRASVIQTDTVNKSLYSGNRVSNRASTIRARAPISVSASSGTTIEETTPAVSMDELAQITDFCKAQYTNCMDDYCNVLDDNQGRCSCSKNLKNYEKTETALKQATESLQDVAQQIQYIGLTGEQIETLFSETEAEATMSNTSDNTQLKNDLDKLRDMIVDVKGGTASSASTTSGISMDLSGLLDFNITNTGFDLGALFGNTTGDTASISNQRGEQLYKTAAMRCKAAVLNDCSAQGVDISVITNSYDLEIDKQCLVYERNLKEANDNMISTVRNAKNVLQRARLMVAQNKNTYDLRGCISALDSCMRDEYVCGADYEYCLDPTATFVVNGELIVGTEPGKSADLTGGLYRTWDITDSTCTAWGSTGAGSQTECTLKKYIDENIAKVTNTDNMAQYLQDKIGTIQDGKALGMCSAVLNQCQDYTYTGTGTSRKYNSQNNVIKSYLERTLVQIKAAQDAALADYAEDCISDVADCLNENHYSFSSTSTSNNPSNVAIKACDAEITTCMSLTGYTRVEGAGNFAQNELTVKEWLDYGVGTALTDVGQCLSTGGSYDNRTCTCPEGKEQSNGVCIESTK